jgi:hypothetical protein
VLKGKTGSGRTAEVVDNAMKIREAAPPTSFRTLSIIKQIKTYVKTYAFLFITYFDFFLMFTLED